MAPDTRPDVLLVTADTMRRDCMAPYGADLMPGVTRLLAEGVAFDRCVAPSSWTGTSFGSMLSGHWPRRHGCRNNTPRLGAPAIRAPLREDVRLLSEVLRDAGYHTICCQGNYGFLGPGLGFARGFNEYIVWHWRGSGWLASLRREMGTVALALSHHLLANHAVCSLARVSKPFRTAAMQRRPPMSDGGILVHYATRALRRSPAEQPVFIWVNYMDMHVPYTAPRRWMPASEAPGGKVRPVHRDPCRHLNGPLSEADRRYIRRRYDNGGRYIDHCIGTILRRWSGLRGGRPRLTIFASDHGEEFWDHGTDGRDPTFYQRGLDHGHTLFSELIHVPLVFHWPGVVPAGRRIEGLVSLVDLVPTLVDLMDLDEDVSGLPGRSLAEAVRSGDSPPDERIMFADSLMYGPERQAAMTATHKLIRLADGGEPELYAWGSDDPGERTDLADRPEHRDLVACLSAALDAWRPDDGATGPTRTLTPEQEADLAERLNRLGYL